MAPRRFVPPPQPAPVAIAVFEIQLNADGSYGMQTKIHPDLTPEAKVSVDLMLANFKEALAKPVAKQIEVIDG